MTDPDQEEMRTVARLLFSHPDPDAELTAAVKPDDVDASDREPTGLFSNHQD